MMMMVVMMMVMMVPQDGPRYPQDGPRWPQDGPKMGSRWAQDGSKIGLPRLSNIEAQKGSAPVNLKYRSGPFCMGGPSFFDLCQGGAGSIFARVKKEEYREIPWSCCEPRRPLVQNPGPKEGRGPFTQGSKRRNTEKSCKVGWEPKNLGNVPQGWGVGGTMSQII